MFPLRMDEQQLWQGMERVWGGLEVEGAGQLEDLHRSQGGKEMRRKLRVVQVEVTGYRSGTEWTPSPGPELEVQRCCRRPSEPRGLLGEEEEEQEE